LKFKIGSAEHETKESTLDETLARLSPLDKRHANLDIALYSVLKTQVDNINRVAVLNTEVAQVLKRMLEVTVNIKEVKQYLETHKSELVHSLYSSIKLLIKG